MEWKTGHNLDALNDLLRGGFGVFDDEPIKIKWINYEKSKNDLGNEMMLQIMIFMQGMRINYIWKYMYIT